MDEANNRPDELEDELLSREFRDALNNFHMPKTGDAVKVQIVDITPDGVLVDLGSKSEGLVPMKDFGERGLPADFAVGKEISVIIGNLDKELGYTMASYSQVKIGLIWKDIKGTYEKKEIIKGRPVKKVKGGFIVDIGLDAFLPISQIDTRVIRKVDSILGQELSFMITKIDDQSKEVALSLRQVTDIEKQANREKVFSTVSGRCGGRKGNRHHGFRLFRRPRRGD
jgi:small subunit ribosomal protein S1